MNTSKGHPVEGGPGSPASAADERRGSWQVPLYLLGLVALTLAAGHVFWPTPAPGPEQHLTASIEALQQELLSQPPDIDAILVAGTVLLEESEACPALTGQVHLLLGTAHLARWEKNPGEDDGLVTARRHLEEAAAHGLPDGLRSRQRFLLGKTIFRLGEDPTRVIDLLTSSIEDGADDRASGYGILAEAYLRLPQPDLQAALAANTRQLQMPCTAEEVLTPARLFRVELLLRLHRPADARAVLGRLPVGTPRWAQTRALSLRARSYEEEGEWRAAVQLWEDALRRPEELEPKTRACYRLGHCQEQLGHAKEAALAWEHCLDSKDPEERQAAAVRLFRLRLTEGNDETALEALSLALRSVSTPADWKNGILTKEELSRQIEASVQMSKERHTFEEAVRIAKLYEKVGAPGRAAELLAQVYELQAEHLKEEATLLDAAASRERVNTANGLFRKAGTAYARSAEAGPPEQKGARYALGVERLFEGGDYQAVLQAAKQALEHRPPPERVGVLWFLIGEAHSRLGQTAEATSAFEESVKHPGVREFQARYQLAVSKMSAGRLDDAKDILERNLQLLRGQVDPVAHEKTLLTLGILLAQRGAHNAAADHLEQVLKHYPESPDVVRARHELGECYRQMALREQRNMRSDMRPSPEFLGHAQKQYRHWLTEAVAHFEELVRILAEREKVQPLDDVSEEIYRHAAFAIAECRSNLGAYDEAYRLYEELAGRYQHRPDQLIALSGMARCCWRKNDAATAQAVLDRLRAALGATDFSAAPTGWQRKDWEEWLAKVSPPSPASSDR